MEAGLARSLLISAGTIRERPPVSSVTTDPAPSVSFQGAPPPRAGRPDRSAGNDSFAALVDNKASADNNNARAQEQTASQRRSDGAAANAADNRRSSDPAVADRAAQSGS